VNLTTELEASVKPRLTAGAVKTGAKVLRALESEEEQHQA